MIRSVRHTAVTLALLLPLASVALTRPAAAGPTSTTSNEVVYTVTDLNGRASVVLRDLLTKVTTTPLCACGDTDFDTPELSPTGDRIVAAYDKVTDVAEITGIMVATRAGGGRVTLTELDLDTTASFDLEPTFSPDGGTVLFTRVTDTTPTGPNPTYSFALMTVPATGGAATPVTGGTDGFAGAYKPGDAGTIAFTKVTDPETGAGDLHVLSAGVPISLGVAGRYPKYSPDGSTLAYSTTVNPTTDRLATVPAGGGSPTVFPGAVPGESYAGVTAWMPDGESILFDLSSSNGFELWAVDSRGTRAGVVVPSTDTAEASGGHVNGPVPADVVPDPESSTFVPVTPTRLLDTRTTNGGHVGKAGPGESVVLQVAGRTLSDGGTIPDTASAVVVNVTVAEGTRPTVVRVFPAPALPRPETSSLNTIRAGQVLPNHVTVKLPAADATPADSGKIVLFNGTGAVHLIVDVAGYYLPGTANHRFAPLEPSRILDTRDGTGAPATRVGPGSFLDLLVIGDSLPVSGGGTVAVPANATAVVLNVTATAPTTTTNIRVFPKPASGTATPTVSNLNLTSGQTAPNLVTVKVGSGGMVRLFNAAGSVHLLADIAGYYALDAPGAYHPIVPTRFLDTRSGLGGAPIATTALGFVDLLVRGTRAVPADALAVVLNLTGTATTTSTVVRAYPATSAKPTISNLNLIKGDSRANAVLVKPGSNGRVRILNNSGTLQLIADLSGYFVTVPTM